MCGGKLGKPEIKKSNSPWQHTQRECEYMLTGTEPLDEIEQTRAGTIQSKIDVFEGGQRETGNMLRKLRSKRGR